ncbi:MAG: hypothetical protein U0840_27785 [Gemmataceae bacterium]
MIEWYTFQALADEVGEDMATKVFRRGYPRHTDYFDDLVMHRDQIEELLALLQSEEHNNEDL